MYAKLEQDEEDPNGPKDPSRRSKQSAHSRSCISLCELRPTSSPTPMSDSTVRQNELRETNRIRQESNGGWGSASCIIHKRNAVPAKRPASNKPPSLITLLQLNVDIESEANIKTNNHKPCVYQLVDRSLIGVTLDNQSTSANPMPVSGSAGGINRECVFTFCL